MKAQVALVSLYGRDSTGRMVCCASLCIKRKQSLSDEQAAECPGIVVDLIPKKLETCGLELMLKKIREATDKKCFLCADGDTQVVMNQSTKFTLSDS